MLLGEEDDGEEMMKLISYMLHKRTT